MAGVPLRVHHQVQWVEADVDVIADGTVIICHDSTLDRTTNRAGRYDDLTVADLGGIDAGGWFSPRSRVESWQMMTVPSAMTSTSASTH